MDIESLVYHGDLTTFQLFQFQLNLLFGTEIIS